MKLIMIMLVFFFISFTVSLGIPGSGLDLLNGKAQWESAQAMKMDGLWNWITPPRPEIITVPCIGICPHGYRMNEICECKPVIAICQWWQFC